MKRILDQLFFLLGLFCTIIILKPNIFRFPIYVTHLIIVIISTLMFINSKCKINTNIFKSKLFIFYYFIAISSMLSVFYTNSEWTQKTLSYAIQIVLIWMPFLILLNNDKNYFKHKDYFIKGFKISIFIHAVWGTLEIILWSIMKFKLNEQILGNLFKNNVSHSPTSFTYINGAFYIRPSGINFEPAYFGVLILIGFFITNKFWIKGYYLILLLISLSRTSLLGLILVFFYILIKNRKNRRFLKRTVFAIVAAIVLLSVTIMTSPQIKDRIDSAIFRSNISNADINKDGTDRHLLYYPLSVEIMFSRSNVLQTIFGYGPRISGYPFQNNQDIVKQINIEKFLPGWSVESDSVDIFVGNGLIGFLLYYSLLLANITKIKDKNLLMINVILLICGITYGFYSLIFFAILLALSEVEKRLTINKSTKMELT